MKKLFAGIVVLCMLASGVTAFAAEEAAADEGVLISAEAQDEVTPVSEESEEAAEETAETEEAETNEEAEAETAEETEETAEADENAEATEEAAAEGEETTEEAAEAEEVVIEFEKIAKNSIVIEGKTIEFAEGMGAIVSVDGIIFVPARAALEGAGYQVSWSDKEQMVMGANQETGAMFIMQVDNTLLFYLTADGVEGKAVMEAAPFKNEAEWRTYVPLKAMAEALGCKLGFDAESTNVTLGK